jgi:hypothetical protein
MKNIDIKSLIIGALLTSTIFLGVAATSQDKPEKAEWGRWDEDQQWLIATTEQLQILDRHDGGKMLYAHPMRNEKGDVASPWVVKGWEPFGSAKNGANCQFRRRVK